ncbi:hypothetical protein ZWY2020_019041 [Hordeum vulgare]|nr:hypothetical protein ZWY2020_019041 [Hordeum vulgare]
MGEASSRPPYRWRRPRPDPPLSAAAKSTPASISTVGDLRGLAASSLDSLKRRLDALHADNAPDLEASHSRISKCIKMHTQSCLKMAEEAEKEHKKMVDKVSLQADEMKASYKKLVTEVQSSSSRVKYSGWSTVEVIHGGFFFGNGNNRCYLDGQKVYYD